MAWQGDIPDERRGGSRRIFILRDSSDGKHVGVGERHALTDLRRVPSGARVWFKCIRERKTGKTYEGKEQTIWQFDGPITDRILDKPVPVTTVPSGRSVSEVPLPPVSDDDIPF